MGMDVCVCVLLCDDKDGKGTMIMRCLSPFSSGILLFHWMFVLSDRSRKNNASDCKCSMCYNSWFEGVITCMSVIIMIISNFGSRRRSHAKNKMLMRNANGERERHKDRLRGGEGNRRGVYINKRTQTFLFHVYFTKHPLVPFSLLDVTAPLMKNYHDNFSDSAGDQIDCHVFNWRKTKRSKQIFIRDEILSTLIHL